MSLRQDLDNLIDSLESTDSTHDVDSFARDLAKRLRTMLDENPPDPRMIRIEGQQLVSLQNMLSQARTDPAYLLRIEWRGDNAAFKVNGGAWTPGYGVEQPPY